MTIAAFPNFVADVKWSHGSGCLKCGSNVSDEGKKVGIQCVDLGVDDEFLGRFGLCYDCALQVARVINFVSRESTLETLEQARALADESVELEQIAADEAEHAKADREAAQALRDEVKALVNKPALAKAAVAKKVA